MSVMIFLLLFFEGFDLLLKAFHVKQLGLQS